MIEKKSKKYGTTMLCIDFDENKNFYKGKFVYITDTNGKQYIVLSSINECPYHVDIVKYFTGKTGIEEFKVNGGGEFGVSDKDVCVYGESLYYGKTDNIFIGKIFEDIFPNKKIEIW